MWKLKIKQYFQVEDYALWDVIENGNFFKPVHRITANADGTSTLTISGPVTAEEKAQKKNDVKARSMLLMALPNKHLLTFSQYKDDKTLFEAIQARFGAPIIEDWVSDSEDESEVPIIEDWVSDSEDESEVLTSSRLVPLTAARPVTIVVLPTTVKNQRLVKHGNPQQAFKDKGVIDSGCSRHMTGNISYLSDFEEINRGYVTFGGNPKGGKITGKGKIKTGKLDFDDVYFVKELKFNLFNVSQMYDKKNSVLFIDIECVVLSSGFKLPDENHLLLRVLRENNMYNVDLKNVVPSRDLTWIKREFSIARTPQQNGVAERKNRTLIEAVRNILVDSLLPIPFWVEAVNTTFYVQNRVLLTKPHNKTPYELLVGKTPSIGFMRPFGCPVTILNTLDPLGIFDGKADEGFLVRYSVTRIGPKWMFDIVTLTQSMNYQPVVAGNQPNHNVGIQGNFDVDADVAFDVKENENEVHVSSSSDKPKKHGKKAKREAKGKRLVDLSTGVRDLRDEFEEFSVNSTNRVNAASAPVTAVRPNLTNSTNSFNAASPSDNIVSLNFEIGKKYSFVDPSQNLDDPDMPTLEDIVYSDDKEDVGAEADFSNLETDISDSPTPTTREEIIDYEEVCAPLARIEAIWLFLAYGSFIGFEDLDYPYKVYKVVKALYELHQAPRAWYGTLANYLSENGFQRGKIDQTLFIKKQKGDILLVHIYVDDIIFGSTNKQLCKAFEKLMKDKFQMSSMGELTFFLGLQVKQKDDGIFISQDKYVAKILRKFGLTDGKSASTPIDSDEPLLKDLDGEDVDVHIYRYLKGKPHLGLWYPKDSPFNLVAYSDSDYTGASLDRKSTTEGCQFLENEDDNEVPTTPTPPSPTPATTPTSPTHEPSPPPQAQPATSPSPPQPQPAPPSSTPQDQSTATSMTLLTTLMETCATLLEKKRKSKHSGLKRLRKVGTSQSVKSFNDTVVDAQEDASKQGGRAELDADDDVTLVGVDTAVEMDANIQGRMEEDVTVVKEINVAEPEPTVFDDEEVTMTMAQTLIKIKAKKARILDEQLAKRLQDEEIQQTAAREKQEKEDLERAKVLQQQYDQKQENIDWNVVVQTFLKFDRDEEPAKKRGAKETLLQESFKKLRAEVKALSSHSTQDTPTDDPKEMSEEDVKNMLQIVAVAGLKVEALQVKHLIIDWEIYSGGLRTYQKIIRVGRIIQANRSFEDMLKDFDREDLDAQ
uniref:Integrase catalytic domain-containing protein n=1 Tax=Tanacetum cinerariifolium TaxID=118510 RepID=A0A6L2MFI9_TANCI|nr:hypothetical protein [Tanacetum cinerariifolium]